MLDRNLLRPQGSRRNTACALSHKSLHAVNRKSPPYESLSKHIIPSQIDMSPSHLSLGSGLCQSNKFAMEIVPNDADVLLGRGIVHQLHPGNMQYNGTI
jgi:hypothetical protein